MEPWQKKIHDQVVARDEWRCIDCGESSDTVHHIISRGRYKKTPELVWRPENLVVLCERCHLGGPGRNGAHNPVSRAKHMRYLQKTFGYQYSGEWSRIMDAYGEER